MICPFCQQEMKRIEDVAASYSFLSCLSNTHDVAAYPDGAFWLEDYTYNVEIGRDGTDHEYYLTFNHRNVTIISAFKFEESYIVLNKYLKLMAFI